MAFAKFKVGTSAEYTGATESFKEYIYACSDTRDVYVFGVKQQGLTDEQFNKITTNFDQSVKDVITSVKNVANGIAGLDENGHLDPSLINGVVGYSVELTDFVSANPGEVTEGAKYFNSTTNKILEGKEGVWVETDPESGILYVRLSADEKGRTNTIYRWSGSAMAFVSDSIVVGEVAGTAYDGAKGAANRTAINSLPGTLVSTLMGVGVTEDEINLNFKQVTKSGLNYGAETDIQRNIPAASPTTAGIMTAADKAKVDKIVINGDGTKYLADNGTYQTVSMNLSEGYKASTEVNEALEPAAGDTYETAIGKLHKAILDNEEVTTGAFVNFQTVLGTINPNQTLPDLSGTNYLQSAKTFLACLQALDTALKTVSDQAAQISDLTSRVAALEDALTLKTA